MCWSWDASPIQKGKRARKKSQTLTTGRIMDFDQKDRNKTWNTEMLDILPYGAKLVNAWPWCEATFSELTEHKVYIFSICADTPAMFDIMCHVNQRSIRGCPYGWCRGKQLEGDKRRVSWLVDRPVCRRKTAVDYELFGEAAEIRGEEVNGFSGKSPLLLIDASCIERCDADFAHSVGYGVVLRYMLRLFKGVRHVIIKPFKNCKKTPRTAAEIRNEEERKAKYAREKEIKLVYRAKQKLFKIEYKHWEEMDKNWLSFCAASGYSTTAVPMGEQNSTASRMTMHECIKYAINCYTDARDIGIFIPQSILSM